MNITKFITNIIESPNNIRNILDTIRQLRNENNTAAKDVNILKNDINIVFRYISGLELHSKTPERLIVNDYQDVSKDHLARYLMACKYIHPSDVVLDFACGCGYGSSCIIINANPAKITGCDIDENSIEFANRFYRKQGIEFLCADIVNFNNFQPDTFDVIVSYETIEHIPSDFSANVIHNLYNWLRPSGKLICSVPDEKVNPFKISNNRYHYRHFTHQEFRDYLESAGFFDIQFLEDEVSSLYKIPIGNEFDSIIAIAYKK